MSDFDDMLTWKKIFSGKFLLCVAAAIVFGVTAISGALPPEAVASIVTAVFMSYFQRK